MNKQKVGEFIQKLQGLDYSIPDSRAHTMILEGNPLESVKQECFKFLAMCAAGEKSYAPSRFVDNYWHEMILDTRLYDQVEELLGKKIHHFPTNWLVQGDLEKEAIYAETKKDYTNLFGQVPDPNIWTAAAECGYP